MNQLLRCLVARTGLGAMILTSLKLSAAALLLLLAERPEAASTGTPNRWILDYSTYLGGFGVRGAGTTGNAITTDHEGNILVAGLTGVPGTFPITQWFGSPSDERGAFITKIDRTGQHILFSTFLNGARVYSLATDLQGNIYIAGAAEWFTITTNALQAHYGGGTYDAFVAKLSPDGAQLEYATPLGGSEIDIAWGMAVDGQGQVFITGETHSTNFPVTPNAMQATLGGKSDAFLAILSSTGSNLVYATYLGGKEDDLATSIALDKAGSVFLGGYTQSSNFLSTLSPQWLGASGWQNAFLTKLKPQGTPPEFLTLIGGSDSQSSVAALTVDTAGYIYVFGDTDATNFPVTSNCWQATNRGSLDNFLAKLNPTGATLVYSTYLGGIGEERATLAAGLAVDDQGNAYVMARTSYGEIAPAGISANVFSGYCDAYVAQIDPSGSALLHLMYLGGQHCDGVGGLALDTATNLLVTGGVGPSPSPLYFPITSGALQLTNTLGDAFITRIREAQGSPANDAFAQRVRLAGPRVTTFENNIGASKEANEPDHAGNPGGKSLWWTWTAPASGRLTVTTEQSSLDTLLAIYTNASLAQLKLVASNDNVSAGNNTSRIKFPVTAGTEYQIAVDGYDGATGLVMLSLTLSVPPNDDFADRIRTTNFPVVLTGSNVDATGENYVDAEGRLQSDHVGSRSVWWEWIAPISGPVIISTEGSSFDTVLGVYTNSEWSHLTQLGINDNIPGGYTSAIPIQAEVGTAYQIGVSGTYSEDSGTIHLKIVPGEPPANDAFTNHFWLTGILTNFTANNYGATREDQEINPWGTGNDVGNRTVWWAWKAPSDGRLTITTDGSSFNTRLAVFTGDALTNLVLVAQNDEQGSPYQNLHASRVNFAVQANTVYQIMVDGSNNEGGPEGIIQFALHFYHSFSILSQTLTHPTVTGFPIQGQGYPGAVYGLEVSTNLWDWETASTNNFVGPSFNWLDTNAWNYPHRFYRWVEIKP